MHTPAEDRDELDDDALKEVITAWFGAWCELGASPREAIVRMHIAVRLGRWPYLGAEC